LAVYLARALWLPDVPALAFGDVGAADWGYKDIGAVADAGIMPGTSATRFSPDASVAREEAMALIIATLRYIAEEKGTDLGDSLEATQASDWLAGFQDRNLIGPKYFAAVAVAYRLGLFDYPAEGWLFPKLGITHQELLGMLDRALVKPLVSKSSAPAAVPAVDAYPNLSKGASGSLVLLLQQRLNAMSYYCGTPDGKYSNQTRDAVYAFQKYQRLKRTGVVDVTDWEVFWAASAPVPVYPGAYGKRVEVDLTRQVMMLIRDNKVFMTVHVSTGRYGTPYPHPDPRLETDVAGAHLLAVILHAQERHPRLSQRAPLPGQPRLHPHSHLDPGRASGRIGDGRTGPRLLQQGEVAGPLLAGRGRARRCFRYGRSVGESACSIRSRRRSRSTAARAARSRIWSRRPHSISRSTLVTPSTTLPM
jgi:peptidoglycan hydrolase-like protein with peptidoglycan-binding domain